MRKRYTSVVIRCEDLQQRCFLYRCLVEKGVGRHDIQIQNAPKGKGDAKQWVKDQHVIEVRALRAKTHLATGLISMVDADDSTVASRKQELDDALAANGQTKRQPADRIGVLVPRRNIETWIHRLQGEAVNETDAYPRYRGEERRCADAVNEFVARCPRRMTDDDPPSLRDGCQELTQFLSARPD